MTRCLGRYELHEVLGTGGFATVYRATDPSLEAVVAVKVLAHRRRRHRTTGSTQRRSVTRQADPGADATR